MTQQSEPLTVFAVEDIQNGDLVVVSGAGARIHRQSSVLPADSVLAKAIQDIKKGTHGRVIELQKKSCD